MKLKKNATFLAITDRGGNLLCHVEYIRNGVAYCEVINGLWKIGFDTNTLLMCREGTHRYVQSHFDNGYNAKVVLTDLHRGNFGDYNERIADALKILEQQKQ